MPPHNATRTPEEPERANFSSAAAAAAAQPPPPRRLAPAKGGQEELGEEHDDDCVGMYLDDGAEEGEEEVCSSFPSPSPSTSPFQSPSLSTSSSPFRSPSPFAWKSSQLPPLFIPRQGHVPLPFDTYMSILQNSEQLLQGKRTYIRTKPKKCSHLAGAPEKFKIPSTLPKVPEKFQMPSTLVITQGYPRNVEDKKPLSALAATYAEESNVIQAKIQHLGKKYAFFRRVRGDGNCFFRSFVFSYLERVVETQDTVEATRILTCLEKFKQDYSIMFGEDEGDFAELGSEFKDLMDETIQGKRSGIIFTVEELLEKFLDDFHTNVVLKFIRVITSIEICKWEEFYKPFLDDQMMYETINEYCEEEVSTMGKEASHLHIQALVNALRIPLRVEYLYSSTQSGKLETNHHDFDPVSYSKESMASDPAANACATNGTDSSPPNSEATTRSASSPPEEEEAPRVTLLYRPGHYDILYPK